jgi:hypothetical protein
MSWIGDVADVVQLLDCPQRRGDEAERAPAADHGWASHCMRQPLGELR